MALMDRIPPYDIVHRLMNETAVKLIARVTKFIERTDLEDREVLEMICQEIEKYRDHYEQFRSLLSAKVKDLKQLDHVTRKISELAMLITLRLGEYLHSVDRGVRYDQMELSRLSHTFYMRWALLARAYGYPIMNLRDLRVSRQR